MIWELVVGGLRIHIIQRINQRLGYLICPLEAEPCDLCDGTGLPQPAKIGGLDFGIRNLLGLPKTCKQMYETFARYHLPYSHSA